MKNAAIRVEAHDEEATTLAGSLVDPIQTNTHPAWTDLVSAAAATGIGRIHEQRRIPTNLKQRIMKLKPPTLAIP
jgi:hypothetical protein